MSGKMLSTEALAAERTWFGSAGVNGDHGQRLLDHISALEQHISSLEADLASLKPSGQCYAPDHINCPCGWDPPQACHYPTPESAGLKPSGQVADDVEQIRFVLATHLLQIGSATTDALSRLAAKAQGYEAAVAEVERLKGVVEQADTERALAQSQTQHERALKDAAVADAVRRALCDVMERLGFDGASMYRDTTVDNAGLANSLFQSVRDEEERTVKGATERLLADNAALVEWIDQNGHARWCERAQGREFRCTDGCAAKSITSAPHPGAALMERMTKARDLRTQLLKDRDDAEMGGDDRRCASLSQRIADLSLLIGGA